MIKAFILYFLSIKSTHGYEIQKYIDLNHMNEWTKIQSGSIYYALSKLEKENLIILQSTQTIKNKTRKIYSITDLGRSELKNLLIDELNKPIYNEKSDKFVAYPFISGMDKKLLTDTINSHIADLEKQKNEITKWQNIKITENSLNLEKVSFQMMISSLDYQIKWHRVFIEEIDIIQSQGDKISKFIGEIDFADINSVDELYTIVNNGLN